FPLYIDSTGNVGMGTSAPSSKLYVNGSTPTLAFFNNNAANDLFGFARNGVRRGVFGATTAGDIYMFQDQSATFPMYIDSTGKFGIGTAAPAQKLDVNGTVISGDGSAVTSLSASNISSGVLGVARGGTGVTTAQGNGLKAQLSTGATTTDDCVKFDAAGNTVDAGAPCGSGGGGGGVT